MNAARARCDEPHPIRWWAAALWVFVLAVIVIVVLFELNRTEPEWRPPSVGRCDAEDLAHRERECGFGPRTTSARPGPAVKAPVLKTAAATPARDTSGTVDRRRNGFR